MYIWAFDDLYIHNFKAIGCEDPKGTLKRANKKLWRRLQKALKEQNCDQSKIEYIDWENIIEESPKYQTEMDFWLKLYNKDDEFRTEVAKQTMQVLVKFQKAYFQWVKAKKCFKN